MVLGDIGGSRVAKNLREEELAAPQVACLETGDTVAAGA
jgi:hypothetical protein